MRALYRVLAEAQAAYEAGESKRLEAWRIWTASPTGEPPELILLETSDILGEAGVTPAQLEPLFAAWRDGAAKPSCASLEAFEAHARATAGAAGRLALRMAGQNGDGELRAAEALWTAYAMTSALRDAKASLAGGRSVFPRAELEAAGYSEADLRMGVVNDRYRSAMKEVFKRLRALYEESRGLARRLPFPQSVEVRYGWGLGAALLARITRGGFDVLHHRPELGRGDRLPIAVGSLLPR